MVDPTLKSKSPQIITKVNPVAASANGAELIKILDKFVAVKKLGEMTLKLPHKINIGSNNLNESNFII